MASTTASKSIQAAWTDQDTFTTVLLAMFIDRYGTEGLTWDPATIVLEVESDFNVALPQIVHDRLLVGIQLLTTDAFFKSLPEFITFCNVLGGSIYNPAMWDPADAMEVAWGVTEAMLICPPEDDDEDPFTDEIRSYIGAVLDDEGIMNAPDILRLALRDPRLNANVQGDFADDPEMFNAIYDTEAGKTQDINRGMKLCLSTLISQLEALELDTGSTKNVVQMLSQPRSQRS